MVAVWLRSRASTRVATRWLCRILGVALGVTEAEARAALAVTAAQVRAAGVLLLFVVAVAVAVLWWGTRGPVERIDGPTRPERHEMRMQ